MPARKKKTNNNNQRLFIDNRTNVPFTARFGRRRLPRPSLGWLVAPCGGPESCANAQVPTAARSSIAATADALGLMSKRGYPEGGFYDRRRDDRRDRRDDYDYDRRDRRDYGGHGYGGGSGSSYSYYGSGSGFSGSNGNGYHNDRDISRGYGAPSSSAARSSSARPSSSANPSGHREEVEWRPPSPLQAPAPPPAAAAAQAAPLTSSTEAAEELKMVLRQVLAARFKNKTAPCFCPFALRGLTPIYQGHREAYARLADYYGWPPDPTAGTQTHKAPCTSGEIKGLQALQQHADKQSAGCRRAVAAYDDDDDDADEEDPATATAHKALAEVLRETTRLPEVLPGSGPKAAAQKTESVSWPPMLYISGIKGVLEDSAGKLKVRFGKWGPDVQCPVYRGPFTGDAVLTFGTPGHAQLPPGSDDAVHLAQAQAFQNAKDLKAVLNSPGGAEAARGVRSARWITEEEFAEWRSEKWAKDLVGNGRWGERMRVRWVNLREQEMKIADATKMRDQEMQRVVESANEERESAVAKAKEEEAKRLALEAAQAARDASLREHRIKVEELTRRLGKEEEQTLVAQEKQRAAEEKEREARKERDLMQRGADELTELMSSALAQKERELQAHEKMRQMADGSAGAEAAKKEHERLKAELQSTRDEKMKREREMKEEIAAKEEERKAAEEAAEGSEYQQYRNDHLYLKDMLVTMSARPPARDLPARASGPRLASPSLLACVRMRHGSISPPPM